MDAKIKYGSSRYYPVSSCGIQIGSKFGIQIENKLPEIIT